MTLLSTAGVYILGAVLLITASSYAFPTSSNSIDSAIDWKGYLHKYGYDKERGNALQLSDGSQQRTALMKFQKMAGIPQTGEVDAATKRMMELPRCGVSDEDHSESRKKRFSASRYKWDKDYLTYHISQYTDDLAPSDVDFQIERALQVWADHSRLSFSRVYSSDADINIAFASYRHGDGNDFDGPSGVLAHAFLPTTGITHFDDSETWTIGTYQGINLFLVAVHEFGHVLGLYHSDVTGAIMAPFYSGYIPDFSLPQDDINGIQHLYGSNPGSTTKYPTSSTTASVSSTTASASSTTASASGTIASVSSTTASVSSTTASASSTTASASSTTTPPTGGNQPNYCQDGQFDVITQTDNGNTYGFRGAHYYMLDAYGVAKGYPRLITDDWPALPSHLDAAFYHPQTCVWRYAGGWTKTCYFGETFFFKGDRVYVFNDQRHQKDLLISEQFPGLPNNIDSAFQWSGNRVFYITKGNDYYRLASRDWRNPDRVIYVDNGYPRPLAVWWQYSHISLTHVDSAIRYANGKTYFFQNDQYFRFNDNAFKIDDGYPRNIAKWWYGCPSNLANLQEGHLADELPELMVPEELIPISNVQDIYDIPQNFNLEMPNAAACTHIPTLTVLFLVAMLGVTSTS